MYWHHNFLYQSVNKLNQSEPLKPMFTDLTAKVSSKDAASSSMNSEIQQLRSRFEGRISLCFTDMSRPVLCSVMTNMFIILSRWNQSEMKPVFFFQILRSCSELSLNTVHKPTSYIPHSWCYQGFHTCPISTLAEVLFRISITQSLWKFRITSLSPTFPNRKPF